jgi:5-methyltetrahydropteroyltriglutamate--homocysteine methyltransferase
MRRSTERILVSHAGTLPRPEGIDDLPNAVTAVVKRQAEVGIDIVNDGELSKSSFTTYVRDRLGGIEPARNAAELPPRNISSRDLRDFPEFFASGGGGFGRGRRRVSAGAAMGPMVCSSPIRYVGHATTRADIENLKAAAEDLDVEPFLPAVAPGTIEHWLYNQHYATDEELLFAVADAMNEEYRLITDSGLSLQIDDPDLPDGWQMFPDMSVDDYRRYASVRVEAINRALRGVPEQRVRLHICWGSGLGPHKNDIDLRDIIDIVLRVNAQVYSIEAANPRHQHEWRVWQQVRLPDGKSLMPGVIGHATDIIEHPRLVADRLVTYARLVGRENVIAGTDCGIGSRVWNGEIAWAKFAAMVEGARIATQELWG